MQEYTDEYDQYQTHFMQDLGEHHTILPAAERNVCRQQQERPMNEYTDAFEREDGQATA